MDHVPPPTRIRWQRNESWAVPAGCVTLLALLAVFIVGVLAVAMSAMQSSAGPTGETRRCPAYLSTLPRVVTKQAGEHEHGESDEVQARQRRG